MISIILATYNEKEHIKDLIDDLFRHAPEEMEIIVVDDNSPDGTAEIVRQINNPLVKLISRTKARGLASAFNRGIIESSGQYLGWMDADMCMPASMIPKMYDKIARQGFDAVIGSRYAEGGSDGRSFIRMASSILINKFAGMVLGYGIKDYDSGFILMKRNVLDAVSIIPIGYGEYFIELMYDICRSGLKVCEIGYRFVDRAEGKSKSFPNIFAFICTGLKYVERIIKVRLRAKKGVVRI